MDGTIGRNAASFPRATEQPLRGYRANKMHQLESVSRFGRPVIRQAVTDHFQWNAPAEAGNWWSIIGKASYDTRREIKNFYPSPFTFQLK